MIYVLSFLTLICEFALAIDIYVMTICPHREIELMNWISKLYFVIRSILSAVCDKYLDLVIDRPKKKQAIRFLFFLFVCFIVLLCSFCAIGKHGGIICAFVVYLIILYVLSQINMKFYSNTSNIDRLIDKRIKECSNFEEFERISRLGKETLPLLSTVRAMYCMLIYGTIGFLCGFNSDKISNIYIWFIDLIRLIFNIKLGDENLNFPIFEAFIMGSVLYVYLTALVIPNYIYYSTVLLKIEKMREKREK